MAQNTVNYANNPTGPELLDNYLAKEQENILSSNSGIQRPSYAIAGTSWIDTSVTPWLYKIYDGSEDVIIGAVNSTTHDFIVSGVDETNLVHKTGNETIAGVKTFTGDNRITVLQNSTVTYNTAPSSNTYTDISFRDKNGYEMGVLEHIRLTNNNTELRLVTRGIDGNWSNIAVGKKADGTTYTYAPTPTAGDNSTNIATTAFVQKAVSNVVHKTGEESISGIKTFSNETRLKSVESAGEHGQLRLVTESYGMIFRNDGVNTYIFPTAQNDPYGPWSSSDKGLSIGNSDGVVSVRGEYGKGAAISDMGKSKAQDDTAYNYIKLGNGLLIQWGKFQNTGTNNYALTFPHPFVNTFWRMITQDAGQISGYSYAGVTGIKDRTTTGCTLYSYYHSRYYDWIAIGYWY